MELSKNMGADITINASKDDPVKKVMEITRGAGVDVVYETAGGSPQESLSGTKTLEQAMDMVWDCGKIIVISFIGESSPLDLVKLRRRSISRVFPHTTTLRALDHTVQLVSSGRIRVRPMISHILYGLDKVPEAFEITANKSKYGATGPAQIVV